MRHSICIGILSMMLTVGHSQEMSVPKLFLGCTDECYQTYFQQEFSFFDFVRDRFEADIQILISRQSGGNGGQQFTIQLLGQTRHFQTRRDTMTIHTQASDSETTIREALAHRLKAGLFRMLSGTVWEPHFTVQLPSRDKLTATHSTDPWRYWVCVPGITAYAQGESNFTYMELTGEWQLRKITEKDKYLLSVSYGPYVFILSVR